MEKHLDISNEGIETLEGSIEYIIYSNEENGYTILEMVIGKGEIVTAVGVMPYVGEGENLKVYGKWVQLLGLDLRHSLDLEQVLDKGEQLVKQLKLLDVNQKQ